MQKSLLIIVLTLVIGLAATAGFAGPTPSGPSSPAVAASAVEAGTWWMKPVPENAPACRPIPDPPAPTTLTCGVNSSPSFCKGKPVDTICGVASGYCAYCWQVPGTPDSFGNLPCACRNNVT